MMTSATATANTTESGDMTMTDELVIEARKGGPCAELGDRCRAIEAASGCFCAAVADRIEALTAERDEAINQLDSATHSVEVLEKRVAKFMADNARLTAALTDARPYLERGLDKMAFNIIRAALKGESHE